MASPYFRPAAQRFRPEKAWFPTGAVHLWGNFSDVNLSRPVFLSKCLFSTRRAIHAWAVVGLLVFGEVGRAATYYVHPVAGDDTRAGTVFARSPFHAEAPLTYTPAVVYLLYAAAFPVRRGAKRR